MTLELDPEKSRPINEDDFARLRLLLAAVDQQALDGDDRPLWLILHELHEEHRGDPNAAGERLLDRELSHGRLVLEALQLGSDRIPLRRFDWGPSVCVRHPAAHFDSSSRPGISRHLRMLRECGVIYCRRHGQEQLYSLDPNPLNEIRDGFLARFATMQVPSIKALRRRVETGQ